jgi:chromosome segregation ATPase
MITTTLYNSNSILLLRLRRPSKSKSSEGTCFVIQDAGKTSFTVADGPVPNPVSEDPSMVKDVKKIEDATASEVQRLKNKLQHVNNTIVQHEKKMNGLERSLATSQNLARQREEESNRLKDRMYENEADARRKIERLTTYTQNLIKDIEKKELQVDQKKADIMLLLQKLEEKEKEIGKAQEESKQVRIESRHQLLAIENKLRKSIEAHQVTNEELSVTRTENSKKIMTLDTTIATQLEQMEESNKLIKLQQIEIQALKAREEELSGGKANARSQLSYFVNKAIDAGKQSTDYKQQFHVTEAALNQARELIKSLRKAKSNLEASLRATLNQQAELQKHLDQALHTIDDLKLDIAQLDSERLGTNRLLDLAYKNQSVIESEIAQNTANHAKHIDERDTKIALLQSKQTVAEMREGKLSRQVQELAHTRDTLSRDLHRCSSDLKGSKECLEALRSEKDALECILQANKVIEKGYQHRAINFEKALSSGALALGGTVQQKEVGLAERWAGDGGAAKSGIPYRFESENQSNQGENKMRGGIVKRGVQGSSKKAEGVAVECGTGREIDDDSFFKGIGPALSPVLDNTVLCGSEDAGRRNVSPPIEGSKVVGGRTHTYAQGANTHITALVPKPPSHQKHAQDYSKRNPEFAGKGGQRSSERETARPRETEREDWGPRTHRLHPISVSEVDGGGRREDARGGGPLTGIGNMLSDDLLYYQRLVRGSGAS